MRPRERASSPPVARHLPGEEGTWVLILGDMTVFALLFGVFVYYRAQDPGLFLAAQESLNLSFGVINTLLLLTSSLLVVTGVRAMRLGIRNVAPVSFAGAFLCGAGFSVVKYLEYSEKISAGLTPATNEFFAYFYVLTGLHFFHLLVGMGVLGFLFAQSRRERWGARRFALIEGGACFWHMVDLLWIVLFPLLYLMR